MSNYNSIDEKYIDEMLQKSSSELLKEIKILKSKIEYYEEQDLIQHIKHFDKEELISIKNTLEFNMPELESANSAYEHFMPELYKIVINTINKVVDKMSDDNE